MSFLKKVAGAFVEMEDTEEKKPPKRVVPTPNVTSSAIQEVSVVHAQLSEVSNEFTQQFKKILEDENKRNYPGNDYFEFKVMKDAMAGIPQEGIKYQAAFAGWATGGNQSKKTLLSTAKIYLDLVQKEINNFEQAYNQQYNQQVVANEKLIEQKTLELQQLAEKVQMLNGEISQLKSFNNEASSMLKTKHDGFMLAGDAQKSEILNEIDKINQYIN